MAAYVASNKGRSGFGFFMLSLILSPLIGFIASLIVKPIETEVKPIDKETDYLKKFNEKWEDKDSRSSRGRWEPSSHKNKEKDELENSFGENPFRKKDEYEYEDDLDNDEYEDKEYEKSSNLADVSAEKIKALNKLKEDGLITEEEYKEKRKKLLEDMF